MFEKELLKTLSLIEKLDQSIELNELTLKTYEENSGKN